MQTVSLGPLIILWKDNFRKKKKKMELAIRSALAHGKFRIINTRKINASIVLST